MTAILEPLIPGNYTALVDLNIRSQMETESTTNLVGLFKRSSSFVVFEVYPEFKGIIWGRVSSNIGSGKSMYVGLRVLNNDKAHLESPFAHGIKPIEDSELNRALRELTLRIQDLTNAIRDYKV
jgi:hypothetical protein